MSEDMKDAILEYYVQIFSESVSFSHDRIAWHALGVCGLVVWV